MRGISIVFGCAIVSACSTAQLPVCSEADFYIPVTVKQPRPSRRPAWVAVGLEVKPNGIVDRTYVIAQEAPASFSVAALRTLRRWQYCQMPASQPALRITHACIYSAPEVDQISDLKHRCEQTTPDAYGYLK